MSKDHPEKPSECESVTVDPANLRADDLGNVEFAIYYTAQGHWMDFFVLPFVTMSNECGGEFQKADATMSPSPTPDPDKGEQLISGYVKWDGCMEADIGSHHFCGQQDALVVARAIKAVYALAAERVSDFDVELAS